MNDFNPQVIQPIKGSSTPATCAECMREKECQKPCLSQYRTDPKWLRKLPGYRVMLPKDPSGAITRINLLPKDVSIVSFAIFTKMVVQERRDRDIYTVCSYAEYDILRFLYGVVE